MTDAGHNPLPVTEPYSEIENRIRRVLASFRDDEIDDNEFEMVVGFLTDSLALVVAEPVLMTDIATRLRERGADVKSFQTVQKWRTRGVFPPPRWTSVGNRDIWHWPDVEAWAIATGRIPAPPTSNPEETTST